MDQVQAVRSHSARSRCGAAAGEQVGVGDEVKTHTFQEADDK